ncbi:acetamidase/formamidase family protein [Streptomyces sp. NBC_01257]|uniref:acetamidase/formamidase family protein n=1 Tax=Streptomyces sp. NBC_01257 TaxID=2903799 RepID=UPI002DD8E92A|nr:acetamidase/formamidase family protein [Streptomyces sp. NBC_01257]WRZ69548.1 acetamidase/formamidase family protein [Streptomyces sp. NBC_01257]
MSVLQPHTGTIDGSVYLAADHGATTWGLLPNAAGRPALTVDSGTTVCLDTTSHEGILPDQGRDPVKFFAEAGIAERDVLHDAIELASSDALFDPGAQGPHIVTGPIAVRGALPGDVLEVEVVRLRRRTAYGVISNRHGRGALPGEYPAPAPGHPDGQPVPPVSLVAHVDDDGRGRLPVGDGRDIGFPLAPFLGIMGVAPATEEPVHSVPPGAHGGNLDIRLLGEGARLFLPVQVPEAMFYAGDPHFAQGDGEVALTAFEAPLRATLRLTLHSDSRARRLAAGLAGPYAETAGHYLVTGLDEDLDEAVRKATRSALTYLAERCGLPGSVALAYLSAAVDLRISQVVDGVKGVHVCLPKADLGPLLIDGPTAPGLLR